MFALGDRQATNHRGTVYSCVEERCSDLPSRRIDEPVALPFPSAGGEEALPFQFHFSSHVGELVSAHQAGGSPVAEHVRLVLVLRRDGEGMKEPEFPQCRCKRLSVPPLPFQHRH